MERIDDGLWLSWEGLYVLSALFWQDEFILPVGGFHELKTKKLAELKDGEAELTVVGMEVAKKYFRARYYELMEKAGEINRANP